MSAVKGGEYVLTADVYRDTDADGIRRRHKRGDKITLTAAQAERLLAAKAVAKPSSDEADVKPGADLAEAPAVPQATVATDPSIANSGLQADDASGGVLSEDQLTDAQTAAGVPPKSANTEKWRAWAVASGKLTEDEAAGKDKAEIQALV